jgi:hypothetical protein
MRYLLADCNPSPLQSVAFLLVSNCLAMRVHVRYEKEMIRDVTIANKLRSTESRYRGKGNPDSETQSLLNRMRMKLKSVLGLNILLENTSDALHQRHRELPGTHETD